MLPGPLAQIGLLDVAVDVAGVRGVTDHHRFAVVRLDEHALVADRVARRRDDTDSLCDWCVPVEQLVLRAAEVEPLHDRRLLPSRALQLGALDIERRVPEDCVLTAVVEVQVAVDDDFHVGRAQVVLGQRLRDPSVDDPPFLDPVGGRSHPGVDEDGARARVLDHESVHRDILQRPDLSEVKPNDLHQGRKGDTANTVKSSATYTIEYVHSRLVHRRPSRSRIEMPTRPIPSTTAPAR